MLGMKKIDPEEMNRAVALYEGGMSISEVVEISKIASSTLYREFDKRGVERHEKRASRKGEQSE